VSWMLKSEKLTFTVELAGTLWTTPSAPADWFLKSRMVEVIPAPFTVTLSFVERLRELAKW